MSKNNTYSQILRTSSIVGGAQAANYLIALVRVKIVALLLGPSGVGLISLYSSAIALLANVSGLGVANSGVREIVRAFAAGDPAEAARTVTILRWACWATGLFGWLLALALAETISVWITGSNEHAFAIRILGSTLLLGAISSGQLALLQGLRRIGDLARANVFGSLVGSIITVVFYFWLRENGILPALIAVAVVSLVFSYWFAKRVPSVAILVKWSDMRQGFGRLIGLGVALMWGSIIGAALDMLTRSVITRRFGMEAAGIYQAAWALSGLFASFILSAMGADFYPRLTAMIHDRKLAARAVNEQTEIGILMVLPGLLAIITFAPLIVKLLYSPHFSPAAELLPWFTLGVFGRVISWPLGFIQLALGASKWFAATETIFVGLQTCLMLWLLHWFGLVGAAYAFAATYVIYVVAMLWMSRLLIEFSWSHETRELIFASTAFIAAAFLVRYIPFDIWPLAAGGVLTVTGGVFSLRGLAMRLGDSHTLIRWLLILPGARFMLLGMGMRGSIK